MKKTAALFALLFALSLSLAACGDGVTSSSSQISEPSSSAASVSSESSAEASSGSEDATTSASEQWQGVSGNVEDATMNTITILTADGYQFMFSTMDADMSEVQDLTIGDSVTVYYTGELDGTDTSNVTVKKVYMGNPENDAE